MNSGIYAISLIGRDDRNYIGSAVNFRKRWAVHRHHLREGTHHSGPLQNAWNKYGPSAFEFVMLEPVFRKAELICREQVWLDRFRPHYNVAPVAGSSLGTKHSDEARARISAAKKGSKYSPEARANMSEARRGNKNTLGRTLTPEHRAKISASLTGRKKDPCAVLKGAATRKGRPGKRHTEETKARIAETLRRRWIAAQAGVYIPMERAA